MPTVTVVIPAYNKAAYLGEAMVGIRQQTFEDWEAIVIDDGSTDRTGEVAAQYCSDPRIRCVRRTHGERSAARNEGIARASSPYIAFLDADDCWLPEKLAKQLAVMEAHPEAGFCHTLVRRVNAVGRPLDAEPDRYATAGWILPQLLKCNCVDISSVLMRRRCVDEVGGFDATLPVYGREDWDLWVRLARRYPVALVEEELTLYRVYSGNSSQEANFQSGLRVLEKLCRDSTLLKEAGMGRNAVYAYLYLSSAASPSAEIARLTRAQRLAWAVVHCPPCAFSRGSLAALARLILPTDMVHAVRTAYRRWRWMPAVRGVCDNGRRVHPG